MPEAMNNYLCLLGWSHPEEKDVFELEELKDVFCINRFTKSPALFDIEKFNYINGQHLRKLPVEKMVELSAPFIAEDSPYHKQTQEWKVRFFELFNEKIDTYPQTAPFIEGIFSSTIESSPELDEINSWETTPQIKEYIKSEIQRLASEGKEFPHADDVGTWMTHMKKELKIKGKPLFMGTRGVLTGKNHGADLKLLIPLTPLKVLENRIG
jgi:glutamyl/glutaminyl-tRNA synthetase